MTDMPNRYPPPLGKCIHCLKDPVQRTWDHLFPRAWYPTSTPPDLEKWQVPACIRCNSAYGKIENDLMIRLGMCLDPKKAGAAGITQKAQRAINPRYAKNPKDARARQRTRETFLAQAKPASQAPKETLYPGFANHSSADEAGIAISIPAKGLQKLTEKICRGIFYLEDGIFVESPYSVVHHVVSDYDAARIIAVLDQVGKVYAREPGLTVRRAVPIDNPDAALFAIEIWGQLRMYASVSDDGG
jgi:hypothetical protein